MSTDELLSINDLAALLGVSRSTINTWRTDQVLPDPVVMGGKLVRFRRADIEQWLDDSRAA